MIYERITKQRFQKIVCKGVKVMHMNMVFMHVLVMIGEDGCFYVSFEVEECPHMSHCIKVVTPLYIENIEDYIKLISLSVSTFEKKSFKNTN